MDRDTVWLVLAAAAAVVGLIVLVTRAHPRGVPTEHQQRPSQPPGPNQQGAAWWPQGPGNR